MFLDNLNFAKTDNVFNNSQKSISNKFIFAHVENKSTLTKQRMLINVIHILFLHIIFKSIINKIISEIDLNDNNILKMVNDKIKEKYMKSEILITKNVCEKLIKLSIKICIIKKYDYECILFFIRQVEKDLHNTDLDNFNEDLFNLNIKIIESHLKIDLKTICISTENVYSNFNSPIKNLSINPIIDKEGNENAEELQSLKQYVKESNFASALDLEDCVIVIILPRDNFKI